MTTDPLVYETADSRQARISFVGSATLTVPAGMAARATHPLIRAPAKLEDRIELPFREDFYLCATQTAELM